MTPVASIRRGPISASIAKPLAVGRRRPLSNSEESNCGRFAGPSEWALHFHESIQPESTRAKVILSACYLEELLRQLVQIILRPCDEKDDALLDGPQAPFAGMSAKIELVYRLGAIGRETRDSLHLVRKIRNRFAHDLSACTFDDTQTRSWNKDLHALNDHATPECRAAFSEGAVGDFEKSVSWLVFWLKYTIEGVPSTCPCCGLEVQYREKIKGSKPE